jgi:hypothetical protein
MSIELQLIVTRLQHVCLPELRKEPAGNTSRKIKTAVEIAQMLAT